MKGKPPRQNLWVDIWRIDGFSLHPQCFRVFCGLFNLRVRLPGAQNA